MINITKTYKTRDGEAVRILATDIKQGYPVMAVVIHSHDSESVYSYTADGLFYGHAETNGRDLVEYSLAQELKVDTPLWVRDSEECCDWEKRHFSDFTNGTVYCWLAGCTSHTANPGDNCSWVFWTDVNPG